MKVAIINNVFLRVMNLALVTMVVLSLIACSESSPEPLSKRQLRELMIASLNQPARWWYLGSDDHAHYLLLENASESQKYSVLSEQVRLKVEKYNYQANANKRVKLKLSKIKIK